jgi:hypothetical protein
VFYEQNKDECEAVWRSRGNRWLLIDEPVSILTGFVYSVLVSTDARRRTVLDAVLAGKDVETDENNNIVVKDASSRLDQFVTDEGEVLDLPDGWFDAGGVDPSDFQSL